ncbi:MAG: hypothetical protein MK095_08930, partial [Phycisphaerales bacterium]|nr:hypothetical protein [Phycisphaerales bacterium]
MAGSGSWDLVELDGSLEIPPGEVDPYVALAANATGELLAGDSAANRVVVYLNTQTQLDDEGGGSHPFAQIINGPVADSGFGATIDMWGGAALVGAPGEGDGRVYILLRDGNSGSPWSITGHLDPPNEDWTGFGTSIAIDAPHILIGASGGAAEGVARYLIDGPNIMHMENWESPLPPYAAFGSALSINGMRALVGAPNADDGHAYLYFQHEDGGEWSLLGDFATKAPELPGPGALGTSVLLSDRLAAVAEPFAVGPYSTGFVWAFKCTDSDAWPDPDGDGSFEGLASKPEALDGGTFGSSLARWNNTLIVGQTGMNDDSGGFHVYDVRINSQTNVLAWTDTAQFGSLNSGRTLELADNMLWVADDVGAIGVLMNDGDIRTSADAAATISASTISTGEVWIPNSIDVEGDWMAAGSGLHDRVVIMQQQDGEWATSQTIDGPISGSQFGMSLRLFDGVLAVGAPEADSASGRVYLYTLDEDQLWELAHTITPEAGDGQFGHALDACIGLQGERLLAVSSPAIDIHSKDKTPFPWQEGRFAVYQVLEEGTVAVPLLEWEEPPGTLDGAFSIAIAIEDESLLIALGRPFRGMAADEPPPDSFGGFSVFRAELDGELLAMEADVNAPPGRGYFGATIDIAPGLLITTAPFHGDEDEADVDLRIDVYEHNPDDEDWIPTQLIRTPDIHHSHEFGGNPQITSLFGQEAIVAGSSRIQNSAGNAGAAELFLRAADSPPGTLFQHHVR